MHAYKVYILVSRTKQQEVQRRPFLCPSSILVSAFLYYTNVQAANDQKRHKTLFSFSDSSQQFDVTTNSAPNSRYNTIYKPFYDAPTNKKSAYI